MDAKSSFGIAKDVEAVVTSFNQGEMILEAVRIVSSHEFESN